MSDRLAAWRAATDPREIVLSGGLTMLIRPVKLASLVVAGTIPLTLVNRVQRIKQAKGGGYSEEDTAAYVKAVGAVVMAVAVDPKVTADGSGDSIPLERIDFLDQQEIFLQVSGPARSLDSFRGEPDGDDTPAPNSEDLRPETE